MSTVKILLADKDPEYETALARALSNSRNGFTVTVISLGSRGKRIIESRTAFRDFDLILLGGYAEETAAQINSRVCGAGRIVIMTEEPAEDLVRQSEKGGDHYWYIYKYGNVNDIISGLNYLIGIITGKKSLLRKRSAPALIGFFSISGGAGKSAVAVGISRELSRYHDKRVLYLSFEEIPSIGLLFGNNREGRDIGDYLYYLLMKGSVDLCGRPEGFTSSDDYGVEAFLPVQGRNDLNHLTQEELLYFLKIISDSGRYDFICMELRSDLEEKTLFLMDQCGKVILIQNDDPVSRFKTRKLITYLNTVNLFGPEDKFLLAVNRTSSPEPERDDIESLCDKNIKRIHIEKDENSFRYMSNRLDIDISHLFGVGVKKIADGILSSETGKENIGCMGNCAV